MHESDKGLNREMRTREVVNKAVAMLDSYDSERSKVANERIGASPTYEILLPERKLTFVGTHHTNNPESPVIERLRQDIADCLSAIDPRKMIFMIEGWNGGVNTDAAAKEMEKVGSVEDAVRRYGEAGVALWTIAERHRQGFDIEITSPEKPEEHIIDSLKSQGFTSEELAAYLALRRMTNIFRKDAEQRSADSVLEETARGFYGEQQLTGVSWISDVRPVDEIREMSQKELLEYEEKILREYIAGFHAWAKEAGLIDHELFNPDAILTQDTAAVSMAEINEIHDPLDIAGRKTRINAAAAAWNGERDKYLIEVIGQAMSQGKKPYVIYGASHATHVELALRELEKIR